ncbi:MAG: hypothetical protein R3C18_08260 [Planctomycetaceae bacterium]
MKTLLPILLVCLGIATTGCDSNSPAGSPYGTSQAERDRQATESWYEMEMDRLELQREISNGYAEAYGSPHFD